MEEHPQEDHLVACKQFPSTIGEILFSGLGNLLYQVRILHYARDYLDTE